MLSTSQAQEECLGEVRALAHVHLASYSLGGAGLKGPRGTSPVRLGPGPAARGWPAPPEEGPTVPGC